MAGVRWGAWQITLCDPIWQVTSRSSEVGLPQEELYRPLYRPFTPGMVATWMGKWVNHLGTYRTT